MPLQHVLIVGGGLAGPALALALARNGIRSTIFEIRSERSDSGGSISLAPNALRPLDKCMGVYDELKAAGFTYTRMSAFDETGYNYGATLVGEEHEGGYPAIRIMRSSIHKVLLDGCEKYPNLITIQWGVRIESIREASDSVQANFEDGTSAIGDILIGADGLHSKVRQHVLGEHAPRPVYSGSCTVAGFVPIENVIKPPGLDFPAIIFTPVGLVMAIPVSRDGKTITFGVSEELKEEKGRQGWLEYEKSGAAADAARKHYETTTSQPVRSLVDNIQNDNVRLWAPYSIPDLPTWHMERVCLIGDAAHALPPNGQGSAQAFEDACILSRILISQVGAADLNYNQMFERFESIRRPRITEVKKLSKQGGKVKARKPSVIGWYITKWLIYAYFAYNRFLITDTRVFAYNAVTADIDLV